ncbi:TPA: hypothetical protein MH515_14890 [Klebsiella pneumoniae]|nr:hypothetical protein [Klebsiella pneumoniae]HCA9559885.1 hypothetical protein [Klebsiella pneumoniae]HCB0754606.1 hypothetical protein [Klebsiella pneumoniae]HDZ9080159.1 hypothetical protein [Klebsiella pneumoniae]
MSEVTVSQEFIDKATIALNKSAFWEFADCPVTIRLAMRQAELDGRRANSAARSAAKMILKRVRDPMVRDYVAVIAKSSNVEKHLAEFEAYRDRLISKVAEEFVEVDKAASVKDYRLQRAQRIAITGRGVGKRTLAEMYAA